MPRLWVIAKSGGVCGNPACDGSDGRMTTHHINYDKADCSDGNLIALCSACNSKANFRREYWAGFYGAIMLVRLERGAFNVQEVK